MAAGTNFSGFPGHILNTVFEGEKPQSFPYHLSFVSTASSVKAFVIFTVQKMLSAPISYANTHSYVSTPTTSSVQFLADLCGPQLHCVFASPVILQYILWSDCPTKWFHLNHSDFKVQIGGIKHVFIQNILSHFRLSLSIPTHPMSAPSWGAPSYRYQNAYCAWWVNVPHFTSFCICLHSVSCFRSPCFAGGFVELPALGIV